MAITLQEDMLVRVLSADESAVEIAEYKQGQKVELAKISVDSVLVQQEEHVMVLVRSNTGGGGNGKKAKSTQGLVKKSKFDALNVRTVSIPANFAGLEAEMVPTRLQDQLFRIVEVVEDENGVTVTARHVWYDNLENYTLWKPTKSTSYTAAAVCRNILTNAISKCSSKVASDCKSTKVGKDLDFERKNLVEAFLDPDKGVCAKFGLSLIRNNWNFYCLKEVGYERGLVIQDGKNLLGVERTESIENLATRVAPIGKNEKGKIVWLNYNNKKYVDSSHISEYSYPRVEIYDTGLQIGKDGTTANNIQSKLLTAAQRRFSADKVDIPEIEMNIEFISLGDTEEYAQYRDLDKVYLYDILDIKDTVRGYSYKAQVIGVEHDVLTGRLNSVTIGEVRNWKGTRKVATWQVPEVDGENIRLESISAGAYGEGSITSDDIGAGAILYAHIASATIDELTADTIDAVTANIQTIIAGQITADSIDTNSINAINAKLGVADIADARIANADIDYAKVKDLSVGTAIIETSITQEGISDKLYINRLMVTYGQMVQATIGDLVIGATDGNYYHVDVSWSSTGVPTLVPTQVSVTAAEIAQGRTSDGKTIVADVGTYADLSTTNFYAINSVIDRITAKRIDVEQLFAREATIQELNTANISNNEYISVAVRNQLGQGKQYRQENAPTNPQVGDIWFKPVEGVIPMKWSELATKTWSELSSYKWEDLANTNYKTYQYDASGWHEIDSDAYAHIELVNNRISQVVDDGNGQITDIKITPEGIDMTGSSYIRMRTRDNTNVQLSNDGIDMSGSTYIRMRTGGTTNMELTSDGIDMKTAGTVHLHAENGTESSIIFGENESNAVFSVGDGGDLTAQTVSASSIVNNGVLLPKFVISGKKPSGHNILWICTTSTTSKTWNIPVSEPTYISEGASQSPASGTYARWRQFSVTYTSSEYMAGNLRYGIRAVLNVFKPPDNGYHKLRCRIKVSGSNWATIGEAKARSSSGYYIKLDIPETASGAIANVMSSSGGTIYLMLDTDLMPANCRLSDSITFSVFSSSSDGSSPCTVYYIQ